MPSWIITIALILLIGWIVYTEMKCGRRNKQFLAKVNEDINELHRSATTTYRSRFGREPTAPFTRIDDDHGLSSKQS